MRKQLHTIMGVGVLVLACTLPAGAQADGKQTLAARVNEMLGRLSSGHSPTADEITAAQTIDPAPSADAVREALPGLKKALDNPDPAMRTYALTLIDALQVTPVQPEAAPEPPAQPAATPSASPAASPAPAPASNGLAPLPAAYKSDVAKVLASAVPQIAARLTDDDKSNRLLAATALGGFTDPPPTVYAPLLAYLKRDDGIGPTGTAVVSDLLQFGPASQETAAAISAYLRRSDQSADARANLVDAIASKPSQNQQIDQTLLTYMASDDNSLRARVILSLPQLDLAPDVFTDTKSRVSQLAALDAAGGQENLQVVNAAKAVTGCWVQVKMTSGCPAY